LSAKANGWQKYIFHDQYFFETMKTGDFCYLRDWLRGGEVAEWPDWNKVKNEGGWN